MNLKNIKTLLPENSSQALLEMADQFEASGVAKIKTSDDPVEQMNDYLQAAEIKRLIEGGLTEIEAIREFSKRIRSAIN
jgi:ribosomal protein L19E